MIFEVQKFIVIFIYKILWNLNFGCVVLQYFTLQKNFNSFANIIIYDILYRKKFYF